MPTQVKLIGELIAEMMKAKEQKMGKSLNEVGPKAHVAEVVHHGEQLILPQGMDIGDAISLLHRRQDYLETEVELNETFDVFPWDGANALAVVLERKYGWVPAQPTQSFFGSNPPRMISIEVGFGKTRKIPWGKFALPNVRGSIRTTTTTKNGRVCFALKGSVTRAHEQTVNELMADVRAELAINSLYAGKAIKMRFRDDNGKALEMPEPKFLDTDSVTREQLIYSRQVQEAIETNLFTPIERIEDCQANGIAVKRGILLGGPYGTGKTLAATVASKLAVENDVTYIYVPRADELADAIEFAKQYQTSGCVIFCEDIDRAMCGERSVKMDDILNILDGIDTKHSNIITVLTTNHLDNINPAMLRPGRLDAVIDVTAPDAEAAERLLRFYAKDTINASEDLTEAGKVLDGQIPAVIAEVVKRAKLVQMRLQEPGTQVHGITGKAVLEAAETMRSQIDLLKRQSENKEIKPTFEELFGNAVRVAMGSTEESVDRVVKYLGA